MSELVRAEVGTHIAKGRPYEIRRTTETRTDGWYTDWRVGPGDDYEIWIDPDWTEPVDFPTEPTWGIAVENIDGHKTFSQRSHVGRWHLEKEESPDLDRLVNGGMWIRANRIIKFIRLTDAQIKVAEDVCA